MDVAYAIYYGGGGGAFGKNMKNGDGGKKMERKREKIASKTR